MTTGADGRGRNEAVFFGPDGAGGRALHQDAPVLVRLGNAALRARLATSLVFEWQGLTVAPFICYDLRFPEVFRHAARRGAEVFCVIANWPQAREDHWMTLLKARAIENQAYVVGVNRCGHDPSLHYRGRSLIFGPRGEVLADGGTEEGTLSARLDRDALRDVPARVPRAGRHPPGLPISRDPDKRARTTGNRAAAGRSRYGFALAVLRPRCCSGASPSASARWAGVRIAIICWFVLWRRSFILACPGLGRQRRVRLNRLRLLAGASGSASSAPSGRR